MSGISTSQPIALISGRTGIDVETFASELDCVLCLIDNGRLGKGVDKNAIGWGDAYHKAALVLVRERLNVVVAETARQDAREAANIQGGAA